MVRGVNVKVRVGVMVRVVNVRVGVMMRGVNVMVRGVNVKVRVGVMVRCVNVRFESGSDGERRECEGEGGSDNKRRYCEDVRVATVDCVSHALITGWKVSDQAVTTSLSYKVLELHRVT